MSDTDDMSPKNLTTETYETGVEGMICRQCEDVVASALLFKRGVVSADASYWKGVVRVTYDPALTTVTSIEGTLADAGYPVRTGRGRSGVISDVASIVATIALFLVFKNLHLADVPKAEQGASMGLLFVIGLLTSVHCLTMCGGILLSQTCGTDLLRAQSPQGTDAERNPAPTRARPLVSALAYNAGRVALCCALGAAFGGLGTVLTYTKDMRSMVLTLAGAAVVLVGLQMWGLFPSLRRLEVVPRRPKGTNLPSRHGRVWRWPALVGAATALMPCAASYTMWLFAMGTGSAASGALSMLAWSLGTTPLMVAFGCAGAAVPRRWSKWMLRVGVILMLALGLKMLSNGIALIG
ncbi:MAG: sulfite exporter TauE/SafE family protein [Atopobiaceae bacterium]|jgi:sulfite exporter TauE/SafE/copper chaperone CopZ|nr:sulfite exporter TauE/SafE family protein [Atopobiaceae bacterium]